MSLHGTINTLEGQGATTRAKDPRPDPDIVSKFPTFLNLFHAVSQMEALQESVDKHPTVDFLYRFHIHDLEHASSVFQFRGFFDRSFRVNDHAVAGSAALKVVHHCLDRATNPLRNKFLFDDLRLLYSTAGLDYSDPDNRCTTVLNKIIEQLNKVVQKDEIEVALRKVSFKLPKSRVVDEESDTDIFFMGASVPSRLVLPGIDMVHSRAKTVDELLLNFDLPCCRAAFDSQGTIYVSAQCLNALLTGKYYLPAYVKNEQGMNKMLRQYRNDDPMETPEEFLFKRLQERIQKYQDRGFDPIFVETQEVLPWIENRFHYGEWGTHQVNDKP